MALKLDMSKAYDRIEWRFLEQMLITLGFPINWARLVMRCVTSVLYSIIVNGQPTSSFTPSRGLQQGDPLSSYLLLICTEGLAALINDRCCHEKLFTWYKGVQVCSLDYSSFLCG